MMCVLCFRKTVEKMSIGVPIKVLHEAEGHIVTCETNTGEVYRGKLIEAEDNMNCQMSNITVTYRDGRVAQLEQVYIRGSKIRFLILPDMLKNAPMLKSMKNKNQGSGAGRGKAAILKAQGECVLGCIYVMSNKNMHSPDLGVILPIS
uniref:Small nuclear ribonucleoprotein Sm D3 n=1 Tax=Anabas testudineus TaxID=64144 RepID=A0A7N6AMX2_ANATE